MYSFWLQEVQIRTYGAILPKIQLQLGSTTYCRLPLYTAHSATDDLYEIMWQKLWLSFTGEKAQPGSGRAVGQLAVECICQKHNPPGPSTLAEQRLSTNEAHTGSAQFHREGKFAWAAER